MDRDREASIKNWRTAALVLVLVLAPSHGVSAMSRIAPHPDGFGGPGDHAGFAVTLFGDTAAVGAPEAQLPVDSPVNTTSGLVEVFRQVNGTWQPETVLSPPDAQSGERFGSSVALGTDLLVVGARGFSTGPHIYTYARAGSTWRLVDEMSPLFLGFGRSLSLSGDTLAVSNGEIYVRSGEGWRLQATLPADAPENMGQPAVDGDIAAVISSKIIQDVPIVSEEYLYLFSRDGESWVREAKFDLGTYEIGSIQNVDTVAVSGSTVLVATDNGVHALVRDAGTWTMQGALDPGVTLTGFGTSLALRGDRAVIGSPLDDLPGDPQAGGAYVFTRADGVWTRQAHLVAPDAGDFSYQFGTSVALGDGMLMVGAPGANTTAGASGNTDVFLLEQGSWVPSAALDLGDARRAEGFGRAVASAGPTLLVGAPDARSISPWVDGAAYVLQRAPDGWSERARLRPSFDQPSQLFGIAVALDEAGSTAAVGAAYDAIDGAVYVFSEGDGTWPEQVRLAPGDPAGHDYFGYSVALAGDVLATGAPLQINQYGSATAPGYVELYARAGAQWMPLASLQGGDGTAADEFGFALSMSAQRLAVGAPRADVGIEYDAGAAYIYRDNGNGWTEEAELTAPLPAQRAQFGVSVALGATIAVVGAGDEDPFSSARGAAYVYERNGTSWTLLGELLPPGPQPAPPSFGRAVAVSPDGSTVLVGAPAGDLSGAAGRVYRFQREGDAWIPTGSFASWSPPGYPTDAFGYGLAMEGASAFVGAPGDGAGGAVYVFPLGDFVFRDGFETTSH